MRTIAMLLVAAIITTMVPFITFAAPTEIEQAMADTTYTLLTGSNSNIVSKSLNLPVKHENGVTIKWSTSNKKYITDSGRVIRPRNDQFDEQVKLTAVFSYNGVSESKEFDFTVLADEPFVDPVNIDNNAGQFMTDEEFFGVWDGTQWTTEGKFDYNNPKLFEIADAAKQGNYILAKQKLLDYMKNRPVTYENGRNEGSIIGETYRILGYHFYLIYHGNWDVAGGDEYKEYRVPFRESKVTNYSPMETVNIYPADNDCAEILIAGHNYPDKSLRPRVEMYVDNELKVFEAIDSVTIRAGQYADTNYGGETETKAKLFGGYLSDDTMQTVLKFDFSSIDPDAKISTPELVVNCRQAQGFEEPKKMILASGIGDMSWDSSTLTWNDILWRSLNFNGADLDDVWYVYNITKPKFDMSSSSLMNYWIGVPALVGQYTYTGDEKYAYSAITRMMEHITTTGKGNMPYGSTWSIETENIPMVPPPRGGFVNPESTQLRLQRFIWMMEGGLFTSAYMTPDVCTTLLKWAWDATNALVRYSFHAQDFGHRNTATMYSSKFALAFPEFTESRRYWPQRNAEKFALILPNYIHSDGSVYQAATGDYMEGTFENPATTKKTLEEIGIELSPEINETFRKVIYHHLQMRFPGGTTAPVWGDDFFHPSVHTYTANDYSEYMEQYNDPYLRYLDSLGQKGEMPPWTSFQWPVGKSTMMRSGWLEDDLALFTNIRGKGNHGHYDDNSVVVYANGRTLLMDLGFNHNAYDDNVKYDGISVRQYQMATAQHNTVCINDTNHQWTYENVYLENTNTIDDWATNSRFDFLRQTARGHTDAEHQRTITFLKSGFWIVSDFLTPKDMSATNNYKQTWRTAVDADISHDSDKKFFTNFPTGTNIVVASADRNDTDVSLVLADGFNVTPWVPTKYSYFERNNAQGEVTFDTVLLPIYGESDNIHIDRIDLDVPTTEATAIKFLATVNDVQYRVYYLLDYEHNPERIRTFEKYKTNGQMTVVKEDTEGRIRELSISDGNSISYADGTPLLKINSSLPDFSFWITGTKLNIEASCELEDLNGVEITLKDSDIKTVEFSKTVPADINSTPSSVETVGFTKNGDLLTLYGTSVPPVVETDPVTPTLKPGFSGGGGGGGGTVTTPTDPEVPEEPKHPSAQDSEFNDISQHWAEGYINKLKERGIVKGNPDGNFNPDAQITRAELLAMVIRALGMPEGNYGGQFNDVSVYDWFSGIIQSSLDAGLISKDVAFRPNDSITREEIAKIIVQSVGDKVKTDNEGDNLLYTDEKSIGSWAVEYVKTATELGLMSGMGDGTFSPQGIATRAQAAAVIERLMTLLEL